MYNQQYNFGYNASETGCSLRGGERMQDNKLLYITDLQGNTEPLTDFKQLTRNRKVNSERTLSLTVLPTENNKHSFPLIKEESIITFDKEDYVIKKLNQQAVGNTQIKQVTAIHKFYVDMINKQQPKIHDGSMTFLAWCKFVFDGTGYEFIIVGSFSAKRFENYGNESRLSLMQKGLNRFKAEMEVKGNTVYLKDKIGTDTDFQFRYGHNIKSINKDIDTTNLATVISGTGAEGIKATYRSDNADIFGEIDAPPVNDERFTSKSALLAELKLRLQDEPLASIPIGFVDLRKAGYPYLVPNEGDRVFVIYEPMDDLLIETRILEIDEEFDINLEPIKTDVVLANHRKTFVDAMFDKVDKQFDEILQDGVIKYDVLDQAVRIATEALQSAQSELIFDNGIIARDKSNPNLLVLINSKGIGISDNGGQTFREAITADGFVLTAGAIGTLSANHIRLGKLVSHDGAVLFDLDEGFLRFNHHDGSYTKIGTDGLERYVASERKNYHYLFHAASFVYGSAGSSPRWITLPSDFRGKDFKVYFAIADSMSAPSYYYAVQRFVCTIHPNHSIDYARARVPVIAYKSSTKSDGITPEIDEVQGVLFAIY